MISFQIDNKRYCIKQHEAIEEIWLFGSYARGEQDQYSDIDLLVVIQDCDGEEYKRIKLQLSQELGMPLEWLSLYEMHKIQEMARQGSYFMWHIKQEGRQLYARGSFQKDILSNLPEYQNAWQDLEDYSIICKDIRSSLAEQYVDITYELSVLASIIRNTSMTIDFLKGKMVFGRVQCVETCNAILSGKCEIPIKEYERLYTNRLYMTGKAATHEMMTMHDVVEWLNKAENLILCAKEIYDAKNNDNNMGRIDGNE